MLPGPHSPLPPSVFWRSLSLVAPVTRLLARSDDRTVVIAVDAGDDVWLSLS